MSVVIPITLQVHAVAAPQQPSESVPLLQPEPQRRRETFRSLLLQWAGVLLTLTSVACAFFAIYISTCTSSYTHEELVMLYWWGFSYIVIGSVLLFLVGCACLWVLGRPPATTAITPAPATTPAGGS